MNRKMGFVLVCLLVGCIATPVVAPRAAAIRYPMAQFTLVSGMKTVHEVEPDFGTAGVVLVVEAGSADEPPEKAGLAHLVEHLVFQAQHGGASLKHRLGSLGVADYNGMTSWDDTRYYAFGPTRNLPALLSLFADVLDDPLASVDDTVFEHERQIVRNELHSSAENGTLSEAAGLLATRVFPPAHGYAHAVIGSEETLARLTLEDARAFAKAHYRPPNCALAVSSPTSVDAQRTLVADVESKHGWAPGSASDKLRTSGASLDAPSAPSQAIATFERPVATPVLWIGWSLPPEASTETDAARLVSTMIHDAFLIHVYDHDPDIAYVRASIDTGSRASLFWVEATLKKGTDPRSSADSLIRTMLHALGEETYLDSNFGLYKQVTATYQVAGEESVVARTLRMADSLVRTGNPAYLRSQGERTIALSSGAVAGFYRRYLSAERSHAIVIRPLGEGGSRATGSVAFAGEGLQPVSDAAPPPLPDRDEVRSWMRAPGVASARHVALRNGLEVFVLPRPGSPFHSMIFAYHGGFADERAPGAGIASLWAKEHFHDSAATWGVEYADTVEMDTTLETLRATGSDLRLTFDQLRSESTFRVYWPPPTFSSRIEAYERQDRAPDEVFERAVRAGLFGSSPFGRIATSAQIRAVKPNDVQTFMDAVRRPDNGVLVIVGDVDPSAAMDLAAAQLGRDAGGSARPPESGQRAPLETAAAAPGERLIVQDKPGSTDAALEFRCTLPRVDAHNWATATVLAAALNHAYFEDWRERAGASYSVLGDVDVLRGGTATFQLHADLAYARVPLALRSLRRFLDQPAAQSLDEDDLSRAREGAARSFDWDLGTTKSLARMIVFLWNLGWPMETVDRYPDDVFAAQIADVRELAEHCRHNWVVGLLGEERQLRAAVGDWKP